MMKICTKCKDLKPLGAFSVRRKSPDGRQSRCKQCDSDLNAEWRAKNPDAARLKNEAYRDNPDQRNKNSQLKYLYGIDLDQYNRMFTEQAGKCKICDRHQTEFKTALAVDHDHETDEVRSLLCDPCNRAIGLMQESPEALESAASYLRRHKIKLVRV
jgi:hypothetical protein